MKTPYVKVQTGPTNMDYDWVPINECDIKEGDEIKYFDLLIEGGLMPKGKKVVNGGVDPKLGEQQELDVTVDVETEVAVVEEALIAGEKLHMEKVDGEPCVVLKPEVEEAPVRKKIKYETWAKRAIQEQDWEDHRVPYLELFEKIGDFFGVLAYTIRNDESELRAEVHEGSAQLELTVADVINAFNNVNHQTIWGRGDNGPEYNPICAMFKAIAEGHYDVAQMQFTELARLGYNAQPLEVLSDHFDDLEDGE